MQPNMGAAHVGGWVFCAASDLVWLHQTQKRGQVFAAAHCAASIAAIVRGVGVNTSIE